MTAIEAMNEVLKAVEQETGKPVVIEADRSLPVHATVAIARGDVPLHVVKYRSAFEPERPYLVSFQCGFILREARCPAESSFEFTGTDIGRSEADQAIKDHFRRQPLATGHAQGLRDQLLHGLLLQIRSMPIGLRVDSWVAKTYPALKDLQRDAVIRQLNENAMTLMPEIRAIAPSRIIAASIGMNAAFATFFSRLWGDPLINQPYMTAGYFAVGEGLLKEFNEIPAEPAHDGELIEAWGELLKIRTWFSLVSPKK
jgi:hypothetical protein